MIGAFPESRLTVQSPLGTSEGGLKKSNLTGDYSMGNTYIAARVVKVGDVFNVENMEMEDTGEHGDSRTAA